MTVLAETAPVGVGIGLLAVPLVVAAIITWLLLTRRASHDQRDPEHFHDQDSHRGPEQGGYYRYTPGMFSHSYAPGKTKYKDMPW
ncbi:hypothetical protein GCM10010191_43880 [Actinomadura vinacea]|uniref:Uncharacterized protein n=1 Tax=Actinomadura vinacea TaxID=115336 RepID=A0ABN3JEH5_9ACTN